VFGPDRKHLLLAAVLLAAVVFGLGYKLAEVRERNALTPVIAEDGVIVNRNTATGAETRTDTGIKAKPARETEKPEERTVTVHILGAVEKGGVYTFSEGARIHEAIDRAVPLKNADLTYVNLAEIMSDQQQVFVPTKDETKNAVMGKPAGSPGVVSGSAGQTKTPANGGRGKININTAGISELSTLPGIGPVTAQKVIDYRMEHGRFKNTSELLLVSGIGEKKLARIKDKITN